MRAQFEKIHSLDQQAFHAYAYEMDEFDAPWHYHPEFELTYILSSAGVRYLGNSIENFSTGDFVLVGPNLPHCWKNTGPRIDKAAAIVLHFNTDLYPTDWLNKTEFAGIRYLLERSAKGIKFENSQIFRDQLLALLAMTPFEKFVGFLQILNRLSESKSQVLCETGFDQQPDRDDHERINRIYQYVRKKYSDKITLSDVSAEVHMTEESFSRFFSKIMRKPFFTFLNEYRINAACKMLIESDVDVTQIAFANGFESLPFFFRQFKRYKNNSPGRYRSMYRKLAR